MSKRRSDEDFKRMIGDGSTDPITREASKRAIWREAKRAREAEKELTKGKERLIKYYDDRIKDDVAIGDRLRRTITKLKKENAELKELVDVAVECNAEILKLIGNARDLSKSWKRVAFKLLPGKSMELKGGMI